VNTEEEYFNQNEDKNIERFEAFLETIILNASKLRNSLLQYDNINSTIQKEAEEATSRIIEYRRKRKREFIFLLAACLIFTIPLTIFYFFISQNSRTIQIAHNNKNENNSVKQKYINPIYEKSAIQSPMKIPTLPSFIKNNDQKREFINIAYSNDSTNRKELTIPNSLRIDNENLNSAQPEIVRKHTIYDTTLSKIDVDEYLRKTKRISEKYANLIEELDEQIKQLEWQLDQIGEQNLNKRLAKKLPIKLLASAGVIYPISPSVLINKPTSAEQVVQNNILNGLDGIGYKSSITGTLAIYYSLSESTHLGISLTYAGWKSENNLICNNQNAGKSENSISILQISPSILHYLFDKLYIISEISYNHVFVSVNETNSKRGNYSFSQYYPRIGIGLSVGYEYPLSTMFDLNVYGKVQMINLFRLIPATATMSNVIVSNPNNNSESIISTISINLSLILNY
jgi:hypothetical protein